MHIIELLGLSAAIPDALRTPSPRVVRVADQNGYPSCRPRGRTRSTISRESLNLPTTAVREGHALAAQLWEPFLSHQVDHQMWLPDQRQWTALPMYVQ
jgi:hypothetical protein